MLVLSPGSHDIYSMRDMRDALGALGPVDGTNPELNNLTCSLTYCEAGDIVFLTSDGISDNFDPVVGKFAIPRKETPTPSKDGQTNGKDQQNGVQDGRGNESSKEEQSKQQSQPSSTRQGQPAAGRQQHQPNNKGSGRQQGSASRQHHSQHSSGRQHQQQQQQRGGRVRRTPSASKEQTSSGHVRPGKQVNIFTSHFCKYKINVWKILIIISFILLYISSPIRRILTPSTQECIYTSWSPYTHIWWT